MGFVLESRETRDLEQKRVPRRINRFGRSGSRETRERGSVVTMASEIILVLRKRLPAMGGAVTPEVAFP